MNDHARLILEALEEWYRESSTGPNAGALLFSDDRTLIDHIKAALHCDDPSHCLDGRCRTVGACQHPVYSRVTR